MAAHDVTPNRSVLLDLKKRIKLTQSGYKIMKMKRDGLIIEFFEVLEKARKMREGVSADYESAMEKITIARAVEGEIAVKSAAYALKADPQVKLGSKSIMGMMSIGLADGDELIVSADGSDEKKAIEEIERFLNGQDA